MIITIFFRNGPDGSVLCVYTFGGGDSDLDGIFKQKYLEQTGPSEWVEVSNSNPVTVNYKFFKLLQYN